MKELKDLIKKHNENILHLSEFLRSNHSAKHYLNAGDNKVYFNLTTSKHWRSLPVGIIRVERELGKYLIKREDISVNFIYWDKDLKRFNFICKEEAAEILDDNWYDSNYIPSCKNTNHDDILLQINSCDVLVSIGLDWDLTPTQEIARVVKSTKCRSVLACYDTIPLNYPEFTATKETQQVFIKHFVDMAHCADKIFAISQNSKQDLLNFLETAEIESRTPNIEVVTLAGPQLKDQVPTLKEIDVDRLRHLKFMGDFVLYVSHFEARKNHRFIINIWKDLYARHGGNCPQLILIGRKGWGVSEVIDQMKRSHAYQNGKIYWFDDVDDEFLINLYLNCSFCVFPSFYEGWGLSVTEALSLGKACVISNSSALNEAAQGLMPAFHPQDFFGWRDEIEKLFSQPEYKKELEETIRLRYKIKSWESFSEEFVSKFIFKNEK
jgi:glycosyltransferase involved in cell wall biosynthesis